MKRIVCVPAGRKRYMEVQFKHILKQKNSFDEYRIWVNTAKKEDLDYLLSLQNQYSFVSLDDSAYRKKCVGIDKSIGFFFPNCCDSDSLYLRIDDDCVWFEDDFFNKMFNERGVNKENFLIFPIIINNSNIDFLQQKAGNFESIKKIKWGCVDEIGWKDVEFAKFRHEKFISDIKTNSISKYKISSFILSNYDRVSVNAVSWRGSDFQSFGGVCGHEDEEHFLSCLAPKQLNMPNIIFGDAICSHFAFRSQREFLDKTNILEEYSKLA